MRELLGDLLLEQQQPRPALAEYETSLASTPNRLPDLYGAAKSANAANQPEKATAYFRNLAESSFLAPRQPPNARGEFVSHDPKPRSDIELVVDYAPKM